MADGTSESQAMIERWKAEHPELAGRAGPAPPKPPRPPRPQERRRQERPHLVPVASPAPREARAEQREMIERWRQEHPELTGLAAPRPAQQQAESNRERDRQALLSDRRIIAIDATPMSVLGAFIIGCILGGIAMTIITGIAFWGFSGG